MVNIYPRVLCNTKLNALWIKISSVRIQFNNFFSSVVLKKTRFIQETKNKAIEGINHFKISVNLLDETLGVIKENAFCETQNDGYNNRWKICIDATTSTMK